MARRNFGAGGTSGRRGYALADGMDVGITACGVKTRQRDAYRRRGAANTGADAI